MIIKNTTLKDRFSILIIIAITALLIVAFGVRLMGKVTDLAYIERMHVVSVNQIDNELSKVEPKRAYLMKESLLAVQQPVNVGEAMFGVEKLLFRALGQGFLLDIAIDDEKAFRVFIESLNTSSRLTLLPHEKKAALEKMIVINDYSERFGEGLRGAAAFVKYTMIGLVAAFMGGLILLIMATMKATLPRLNETVEVLGKVAVGDLAIRLEASEEDEIGQIQSSTGTMIAGLRTTMNGISGASDTLFGLAKSGADISRGTLTGVQTQKEEMQKLVLSIGEMSTAINDVASTAEKAADSASTGNETAIKGKAIIIEAVQGIEALAADVDISVDAIRRIEQEGEKIGAVVQMIQDITEQTNLLALNAAIEAARAGEHGRGFAVVADEVRTLAKRTQKSTQEINEMIDGLRRGTSEAVDIMNKSRERAKKSVESASSAGEVIEDIVNSVSTIVAFNQQIACAAEQQSAVTNEINHNIRVLSDVVDKATAGGEETARMNDELVVLSSNLNSMVGVFKL